MTIKDFKRIYTGNYDIYLIKDGEYEYPELLYSSYYSWLSLYDNHKFFENAEILNLYAEADPPSYTPVVVIQIETY